MCTKAEVKEVVEDALKPITISQKYVEKSMKEFRDSISMLPCGDLSKRVMKLEFENADQSKEIENLNKVWPATRKLDKKTSALDTRIATLEERSNNQKEWSTKTWALLILGINLLFGLALKFI